MSSTVTIISSALQKSYCSSSICTLLSVFKIIINYIGPQIWILKFRSSSFDPQISVLIVRSSNLDPQVCVLIFRSSSLNPQISVLIIRSSFFCPQVSTDLIFSPIFRFFKRICKCSKRVRFDCLLSKRTRNLTASITYTNPSWITPINWS